MNQTPDIISGKPITEPGSPQNIANRPPSFGSYLRFLLLPAFPLALFLNGAAFYAIAHFWFGVPHPAWLASGYLLGVLGFYFIKNRVWKCWKLNWLDSLFILFVLTVSGSLLLHSIEGKEKALFYFPAFILFPYICARVVRPAFWPSIGKYSILMGMAIMPLVTYEIVNLTERYATADRIPIFNTLNTTYSVGGLLGTLMILVLALSIHPGKPGIFTPFFSRRRHGLMVLFSSYAIFLMVFIGARGALVAFLFSALILLLAGTWKSIVLRSSILIGLLVIVVVSMLALPLPRQQFYEELLFFKDLKKIKQEISLITKPQPQLQEKPSILKKLPIDENFIEMIQVIEFIDKDQAFAIKKTDQNKAFNLKGKGFDIQFPVLAPKDTSFSVFFIHEGPAAEVYTMALPNNPSIKIPSIKLTKTLFATGITWSGKYWFPLPQKIVRSKLWDCSVYGKSTLNRILLWNSAWTIFKHYPLFGIGAGNYDREACLKQDLLGGPHNFSLHVLSELGLFGFVIFLGMAFGSLGFLFRKVFSASGSPRKFACWLLLGVLGFHLSYDQFFGNYFLSYPFYFLLGIVASFIDQDRRLKQFARKNH